MLFNRAPLSALSVSSAGLTASVLMMMSPFQTALAKDPFGFADERALAGDMDAIGALVAKDVEPGNPCRLFIVDDDRGRALFSEATLDAMRQGLATSILGAGQVDGCNVESHNVDQADLNGFIDDLKTSGKDGLVLSLSFYGLGDGVTAFATLRGTDGRFHGSTGRFNLSAAEGVDGLTSATGSTVAESEPVDQAPSEVAAVAPEAPAPPVPAPRRVQPEAKGTARAGGGTDPEQALRRQRAEAARIGRDHGRAFNLRRIKTRESDGIGALRLVDATGRDTGLMAEVAAGFLQSATTAEAQTRGLILASTSDDVGIESVDIRTDASGSPFEAIFDNSADLVVTRQPISAEEQQRFEDAFGVNMRSRYAEHVVAIASNGADAEACGVIYPESDMLMTTEDHPAAERVYLYSNPSIPGTLRDRFLAYALSSEGQGVVAEHGFDLSMRLGDAAYTSWRYRTTAEQEPEIQAVRDRFRELIRTSERVSSTFRFEFASSDLVLDSRSEQDLENLIDLIKGQDIDNRRILLFGFADSSGAAPYNVDLSRERADAVATRLRLAGIAVPPRNVYGVGEDSPIACNDLPDGSRDELGAQKNRRVEVWIES